jgi:CRP-like cAMP-binding protein
MPNAFIRKTNLFARLTDADTYVLQRICSAPTNIKAHQDLISEGAVPDVVHLILAGFACRYKILPDGARSIIAYLVPGDMCDWHVFVLREMDHSVATLSPCEVVEIPRTTVLEITAKHPAITRALWWMALVDEAVLREWIVNVGRRSAEEAVAHLFCELLSRLESVGLRIGDGFELPVTQTALSVTQLSGLPCWAATNATLLSRWVPADGVRRVVVYADNDENGSGQAAAYSLQKRLVASGLHAIVEIPPILGEDWNDVLIRQLLNR